MSRPEISRDIERERQRRLLVLAFRQKDVFDDQEVGRGLDVVDERADVVVIAGQGVADAEPLERRALDFLRRHSLLRYVLLAALIASRAVVVPDFWTVDRTANGSFPWFEHVPFILSIVLAFAALKVVDPSQRARVAIGVILAFGLTAAVVLSYSVPSLLFLALGLAVGCTEWPIPPRAAHSH